MPSVWERVSRILEAEYYRVEPAPKGFIRLHSNENFFLPKEFLSEVMEEVSKVDPSLYPREFYDPLVEEISEYLSVDRRCVVLGCGGDQLLSLICGAFLGDGLKVLTVEPTYAVYRLVCSAHRIPYTSVPLNRDFIPDVSALLEEASKDVGLIILCSPNNPTGNSFPEGVVREVVEESRVPVLLDEAYAEYAGKTLAGMVGEYENLIVLRTFSKAFGLAGLRAAYLVADGRVAEALRRVQLPYPMTSVSAVAATLMLRRRGEVFKAVRRLVEERERLLCSLRGLRGLRPHPSETNFLLVGVPRDSSEFKTALRKRRILVRDVGDIPHVGPCLRITVGLPWMNRRLIEALSEVLESLES